MKIVDPEERNREAAVEEAEEQSILKEEHVPQPAHAGRDEFMLEPQVDRPKLENQTLICLLFSGTA